MHARTVPFKYCSFSGLILLVTQQEGHHARRNLLKLSAKCYFLEPSPTSKRSVNQKIRKRKIKNKNGSIP